MNQYCASVDAKDLAHLRPAARMLCCVRLEWIFIRVQMIDDSQLVVNYQLEFFMTQHDAFQQFV